MENPAVTPTPQLGHKVRDRITGLVGVVVSLGERMNGNLRFVMQCPPKEGNILGEQIEFDAANAEYVDEGVRDLVQSPRPSDHILLGSKVQDTVTGFVGIATTRSTTLNGCVHFYVEPPVNQSNEVKLEVFPSERLVMIQEPKTPAIPASKKVQGGPVSRPVVCRRG